MYSFFSKCSWNMLYKTVVKCLYITLYIVYVSMFSSKLACKYKYSILSINNFIKIELILLILY